MRRFFPFLFGGAAIVLFAMGALPCFAGEVAVLKNGFTIQHERREVVGDVTRLYVSADGASFVDIPSGEIDHYEEAPDPPVSGPASAALRTGSFRNAKSGVQGFPGQP